MAESFKTYRKKQYEQSDAVNQAQQAVQNHQTSKPGAYQSGFQQQLDETMDKIMNREKFHYDLNGDALYQSLRDQAVAGGKKAMMDTMGRAATMTGGYGNSYAQQAGQQAYQGQLQKLGDKIPQLYQLALQRYNLEGQQLKDRYGILAGKENQEYGRYQDAMNRYQQEQDRLQHIYESERGFDYGKYRDDLAAAQKEAQLQYQKDRDALLDKQALEKFQYQQMLDKLAQEQWQKEFDEDKRRYEEGKNRGGGGGSSGGSGKYRMTLKDFRNSPMLSPDEFVQLKLDKVPGLEDFSGYGQYRAWYLGLGSEEKIPPHNGFIRGPGKIEMTFEEPR